MLQNTLILVVLLLVAVLVGWWIYSPVPQPGTFDPIAVTLKEVPNENVKELIDTQLVFVDAQGTKWIAPKGTWTDGASVPRLALWISDGRFQEEFLKAAIVHDAYCQEFNKTRCKDQYHKLPWRQVHRMFFEACIAGKTDPLKAKLMFAGVWWGGPKWDDPASDLSAVPDDMLSVSYHGCEQWIKTHNPSLDQIESWMTERTPVIIQVAEDQSRFFQALEQGRDADATLALQRATDRVDSAIRQFPNDLMLKNLKGYNHKNHAISYRQHDQIDKSDAELQLAQQSFSDVLKVTPHDPSALNGMGSVSIMRQDFDQAERYIQQAIQIKPDYPAAIHDLELIKQHRRNEALQEPLEQKPLPAPKK